MSKHLNFWIKGTGEEKFNQFIKSVFAEKDQNKVEERLLHHTTAIYRDYKQNHDEKHFRENKIVSGQ